MKKIFALLLSIVLIFSVSVVAFAVEVGNGGGSISWDEIQLGGYARGDVNADGEITSLDALQALKQSVGKISLTGTALERADMNNDGNVTTLDARQILKAAAGNA